MFYPSDRVLVGIMNSRRDLAIAQDEGWYRIPKRHAPESTTEAVVLAFYFTKAFGGEKWAIHYYAPVEGHELVRRRDLLPHQLDHPHADEPYYKLQLGPHDEARRTDPQPSLAQTRLHRVHLGPFRGRRRDQRSLRDKRRRALCDAQG